jgi:preprotein translocase subunit YajC
MPTWRPRRLCRRGRPNPAEGSSDYEPATSTTRSITGYLIVIVALFALLWLFVLRPQRRRSTEQLQMQDTLRVGDEVITAGGIRGYVRQLDEEVLKVEIAPEVVVRLDRRAVAALVQEEDDDPDALTQTESGES